MFNKLRLWFTEKKEINFTLTIQDSLIIKGIAICFMLWHHLFGDNPEYGELIYTIAGLGKVCVSLFLFVSAYGLSIQHEKEFSFNDPFWHSLYPNNILRFYIRRLLKLYSHFWVIFILCVPIGIFVFDRTLSNAYGEKNIAIHLMYDFFGLGEFNSYNVTWWFYRLIIALYLFFPFIYVATRMWNIYVLMIAFLLLFDNWFYFNIESYYLFSFILGVSFALNRQRVTFILNLINRNRLLSFLLLLFGFTVYCRGESNILNSTNVDGILSLIIALIVVLLFRNIQYLSPFFILLGKHSMNIFMIHTFIYHYFFMLSCIL